jgi:hypothetical protein
MGTHRKRNYRIDYTVKQAGIFDQPQKIIQNFRMIIISRFCGEMQSTDPNTVEHYPLGAEKQRKQESHQILILLLR